jgi:hypothetical protein
VRAIIGRILCACAAGAGLASSGCGLLDTVPGTWSGHVELLQFASGSDAIKMTIASASASSVTGTVLFGGGPLLAPATDPTAVYPPAGVTLFDGSGVNEVEGFEYTIAEGTFVGGELQLSVNLFELWAGWCKLQTPVVMSSPHPVPEAPTVFGCGPTGNPPIGTDAQENCQLLCACTETACAAQTISQSGAPISLDLIQSDDQLSGSVLGLVGQDQVRDVVMTKQ